ncbi:MAG: glycoside hydrolase family 16 protein [Candidatus Nanopelagicales bacterium]
MVSLANTPRKPLSPLVGVVAVAATVAGLTGGQVAFADPAAAMPSNPTSITTARTQLTVTTKAAKRSAGRWQRVFAEGFGRSAPRGTFLNRYRNFDSYRFPATDTSRQVRSNPGFYNTDRTVSATGGKLDSWLHYDSSLGKYLVAAVLPQLPRMRYGKFSMRLRADTIPGYKIAPLLWPDSGKWPNDGEIDFPEGDLNGGSLAAFHHHATSRGTQQHFSTRVSHRRWHTYETIWTPGRVAFRVDGRRIGVSRKQVPNKPMHWVLQFETAIRSQAPSKGANGHVQIDWIKASRYR